MKLSTIATRVVVTRAGAISTGMVVFWIGAKAVVVDLFPEKVGAGLLEDWIEAGHVSPRVDDVGDGGPIL